MEVSKFLESKVDNLIKFLESLSVVNENSVAMSKLPSFRDIPWLIGFCKAIRTEFRKNPEKILEQLIEDCGMAPSRFSSKEMGRFMQYLECFVETVEKNC